jgi:hypothetical protein
VKLAGHTHINLNGTLIYTDRITAPGPPHAWTSILAALTERTADGLPALADLGYEGEADTFTLPIKKPAHGTDNHSVTGRY